MYGYDGAGDMTERDKVLAGTKTYTYPTPLTTSNQIAQVNDASGEPAADPHLPHGGNLRLDNRVGGGDFAYSYNSGSASAKSLRAKHPCPARSAVGAERPDRSGRSRLKSAVRAAQTGSSRRHDLMPLQSVVGLQ